MVYLAPNREGKGVEGVGGGGGGGGGDGKNLFYGSREEWKSDSGVNKSSLALKGSFNGESCLVSLSRCTELQDRVGLRSMCLSSASVGSELIFFPNGSPLV